MTAAVAEEIDGSLCANCAHPRSDHDEDAFLCFGIIDCTCDEYEAV